MLKIEISTEEALVLYESVTVAVAAGAIKSAEALEPTVSILKKLRGMPEVAKRIALANAVKSKEVTK